MESKYLNQKNNLISISKVYSYKKRCIKNSLFFGFFIWGVGTIYMIYAAFFIRNLWLYLFTLFFLFGTLCYINLIITEGKCFICQINIKFNKLYFSYYERNLYKELSINIENCKTKVFSSTIGISHSSYICFYDNSKLILKQYTFQDWTPEVMQSVAQKIEELKKEYKKEHETNTHLH